MSALAAIISDVLIHLSNQFVIHFIIIKDHYQFTAKIYWKDSLQTCLPTLFDPPPIPLPSPVLSSSFIQLSPSLLSMDFLSILLLFSI